MEIKDFLARVFPDAQTTILGGPYLDIRRPNLHDSKGEFREELKFVERSAEDLFALYRGLIGQGDPTIETARGLHMDFLKQARERNKAEKTPKTAIDLAMDSVRRVDYWSVTKRYIFDLYLSFSNRHTELQEQNVMFWSAKGRPPDHYARAMAVRFAKLYVKETGRLPTIGTASEGDHPSTDYGRYLQELFEILEITTGFRLPGEWAVSQVTEADLQPTKPLGLFNFGMKPNLGKWGRK